MNFFFFFFNFSAVSHLNHRGFSVSRKYYDDDVSVSKNFAGGNFLPQAIKFADICIS